MKELEKLVNRTGIDNQYEYGESIPREVLKGFADAVIDWVAKQHYDQCQEQRPVQNWIRSTKTLLDWELTT